VVSTRSVEPAALIATRPFSRSIVVSSTGSLNVVSTLTAGETLLEINDEDLLALAAPNPAVLVRHGPHAAELVFAQPGSGAN
jgi:hypothetical protein